MMTTLMEDDFTKKVDEKALQIIGYWQKQKEFKVGMKQYTETDCMEFHLNGTGVWKLFSNTDILESMKDSFHYKVLGNQIVFSYSSLPEQYDIVDYRMANGLLLLISNFGMPGECIEVYSAQSSGKSKNKK